MSAEKNITLLGRRGVQTVFGGTGSGAGDENQCVRMADAFTAAGFTVNPKVLSLYQDNLDKVPVADPAGAMDRAEKQTYYIGEFPQSFFTDEIVSSYADYKDAAVVVFGRQGGEGMDFSTDLLADVNDPSQAMSSSVAETANYKEGQHQLELSMEEKELLAHAEANFDKVIVIINSANIMEIGCLRDDPRVDAILWIAHPGSRGCEALASILAGTVNPSGRTVDTWAVDFTADPTFPNTSARRYGNVSKDNALADSYVLQYEEGIYFGYRWYETVYADGGTFIVSKDGQAITKGMFLAPSTYTQYIDAASTYPVFKHCRVRGNDGAYYVTSSSGSVEYFYIIALEGDNTCVILDTAVSEDAATDIAAALVFDVSQQTFEGSK